ncbi:MAG: hypothetical protein SFV51_10990 [Bryobacteraceae bacterium]|nr:hypothetical protein [Bryobacteraceae bacterium]
MACAWAQEPRLPPELEELAGLGRALPPEFAADVLLQVAGRLGAKHLTTRRELLEDAFVLAGRARLAMPRKSVVATAPESAEAILSAAYSQGLDTLSLQSRAVRQMHSFDAKLAAEYFARLADPPREPHTCADHMVWDSSPYWEAAEVVAPPALRAVVSPLEIGPAVKAHKALKRSASPDLLAAIQTLSGDDRAFAHTVRTAPRDLETLAIDVKREGGDPAPMLEALASYLRRHVSGRRCADTLEHAGIAAQSFAGYYNTRLRAAGYLSEHELPPIREEEMAAGSAIPVETTEAAPPWLEEFRKLRAADPSAAAMSKLYEQEPLVWWLAAKPMLGTDGLDRSSNLVLATYARLR